MKSSTIRALTLLLAPSVAAVVGCSDGPRLVPANGVATLEGKPLEGATLAFIPVAGNPVSTAGTDKTGADGSFRMTFHGRSGLAPGKYRVLVSKTQEVAPKGGKEISSIFAKASFEKQLMGLTKETIPPQNFEREIEVPENGATDFALDFKAPTKKTRKGKS